MGLVQHLIFQVKKLKNRGVVSRPGATPLTGEDMVGKITGRTWTDIIFSWPESRALELKVLCFLTTSRMLCGLETGYLKQPFVEFLPKITKKFKLSFG